MQLGVPPRISFASLPSISFSDSGSLAGTVAAILLNRATSVLFFWKTLINLRQLVPARSLWQPMSLSFAREFQLRGSPGLVGPAEASCRFERGVPHSDFLRDSVCARLSASLRERFTASSPNNCLVLCLSANCERRSAHLTHPSFAPAPLRRGRRPSF